MEEKVVETVVMKEIKEGDNERNIIVKEENIDAATHEDGSRMDKTPGNADVGEDELPKSTKTIEECLVETHTDNNIGNTDSEFTTENSETENSLGGSTNGGNEESRKEEISTDVPDISDKTSNKIAQSKNYKNVILDDWDVEIPQGPVAEVRRAESTENINNNNNNNNSDNPNANTYDSVADTKVEEDRVNMENNDSKQSDTGEVGGKRDVSKSTDGSNGVNEKNEAPDRKPNDIEQELIKTVLDKKKNPLKYSNLIVSNQDIVEILDNSVERVCRPIIPAKDIFLSIELTKHLNQKLSATTPGKKNLHDTLETKTVANSNEVSRKILPESPSKVVLGAAHPETNKDKVSAQRDSELSDKSITPEKLGEEPNAASDQNKKGKKKFFKKNIFLGDEMARSIALRQLRDGFPSTRKRSHTTKKINHIPFLASSVLEKALTSASTPNTPVKTGGQRRRPCYLPDSSTPDSDVKLRRKKVNDVNDSSDKQEKASKTDKNKELNSSDNSVPVVRTYCIKRKSTDSEKDVKSALETFITVSKEYQERGEENIESKPKKQKTVQQGGNAEVQKVGKATPKKGKTDVGGNRKRNLELEKLLGDEGAVRMLYETQHMDDNNRLSGKKSRAKSTLGLKKDLILKTKLVKNAVLRLSGTTSDGVSLRGKRGSRSVKSEPETAPEPNPLFITSTPNVILYKPKQKQRAEASRILYRHSSSESFESLDGYRRTSFEGEGLSSTNNADSTLVNGDLFKEKSTAEIEEGDSFSVSSKKAKVPRKTKVAGGKRLKKLQSRKERQTKIEADRENVDCPSLNNSKFVWSNVPVRKSFRPRMVSKKYSIWASTSMDSLSVESLGLKKPKKASQEFAKKLNYKELRILQHGSLVQIILAPSSTVLKNSFNEQVLTELKEALDFLAQQESCSVILLTSNGTAFCQGIDLNYVLSVEEDDRKQTFGNLLSCLKKLILCMANYTKPIIAAVHAVAIGLGVTLLAYCDIVVCSDRASFYTPYARLGQVSEGAPTVTFPRINNNLATELLFKSEKLSASEAMKFGLVSQIIPEDRFEDEVMLLSRRIASQSMQAMQSMKSLMNRNDYDKIVETLEVESDLVLEHWCSNECINNIIKFLNSGEVQFRHLDVT